MKKTKRMTAAIMSAMMMSCCQCFTASAYTIPIKNFDHYYSYNELAEMTDEELTEMFDIPEFNNETISEEEKFISFFNKAPSYFIGDDYMSETYYAYLQYKSGDNVPYLSFFADTEQPLDPSFDPSQFGYPSDWTVELIDEIDGTPDGNGHRTYGYRVLIPAEIMTDFESCICVYESEHYASNSVRDKSGLYGVTSFAGTMQQYASYGENVTIIGDANCDGKVTVADAVAVLQYIANAEKYPMSEQARFNADIDGEEGITGGDAIAIQKIDAGIWDES